MGYKIKKGMGGSNNGKGRYDNTEILKKQSKTPRREEGKKECNDQLDEHLQEDIDTRSTLRLTDEDIEYYNSLYGHGHW